MAASAHDDAAHLVCIREDYKMTSFDEESSIEFREEQVRKRLR